MCAEGVSHKQLVLITGRVSTWPSLFVHSCFPRCAGAGVFVWAHKTSVKIFHKKAAKIFRKSCKKYSWIVVDAVRSTLRHWLFAIPLLHHQVQHYPLFDFQDSRHPAYLVQSKFARIVYPLAESNIVFPQMLSHDTLWKRIEDLPEGGNIAAGYEVINCLISSVFGNHWSFYESI